MSEQLIRAREISDYVYCRRSWWLSRVAGYQSRNIEAMERGVAYHEMHGRLVGRAVLARRVAYLLVFLAVAVFVFVLVYGS